jgi:tetratricopeptide (TPR) repeat protein
VQSNPANAEAYAQLCRVYFLMGDWDGAIANGQKAVQLAPGVAQSHLWLGRAYGRKAEESSSVIAFALARKLAKHFEDAYQIDPGNWNIRRDLAEFYVEAPFVVGGGEQKAERVASRSQSSDPVGSSLIRAMIASKDKNWGEAERQYRKAIEAADGAAGPWLDFARYFRSRSRWAEFDDAIRHALSAPKRSESLFDAGELLTNTGRMLPQAADLLRAYLRGNTWDDYGPAFRAHYLLGQALEKQGQRQAAIGEYRDTLSLASNYRPAQEALRRLGA